MESTDRIASQNANRDTLAGRLREIRLEIFGNDLIVIAEAIGIPSRTWANYESGVAISGDVLLAFLDATRVDPRWLRTGMGPKFRQKLFA